MIEKILFALLLIHAISLRFWISDLQKELSEMKKQFLKQTSN